MTIEVGAGLSLLISVITFLGLIVGLVTFFMKLKWDSHQHDKEITQLKDDLNKVGNKVDKKYEELVQRMTEQKVLNSDEVRNIGIKVDAMDKSILGLTLKMEYISETVKALKEKLCSGGGVL